MVVMGEKGGLLSDNFLTSLPDLSGLFRRISPRRKANIP